MAEPQADPAGAGHVLLPATQWRTVPERIADQILAAVAVGVLQPRQRLPSERHLSTELGVSRTSVRLALSRLAANGVVESRRGRHGGTFVGDWEHSREAAERVRRTLEPVRLEMEAMFDYRSLVEQLIARTAARRHSRADVRAMRAALSAYRAAKTLGESRAADRALHSAVADAARNEHLKRLSADLVSRANLGFPNEPYRPELRWQAVQQHADLVGAITAGDGELSARIAGDHFQVTTGDAWRSALGPSPRR
ncbi:MAG: FadR/GntR family transcriptional regulator [Nocardioidaceae bacterium]